MVTNRKCRLDHDDSEALTPNHFLIRQNGTALACVKTDENYLNVMSSRKAAQRLADILWKR